MITLPVNMIPLSGGAVKPGVFVVAVLIGLALFAASRSGALGQQQPQQPFA